MRKQFGTSKLSTVYETNILFKNANVIKGVGTAAD
jgi:hypothetical protein